MSTVVRLNNSGLRLCVYGGQREHPPPHCHLTGPNSDCQIDLATLEPTKGHYERKDFEDAKAWRSVRGNYGVILAEWRRLNERD